MSDATKRMECEKHGESAACFICGHLSKTVGAGFFTSDDGDGDPRPDAWCARCEEVLKAEGEWNDRSEAFANITVRCSGCYDDIKRRNAWVQQPAASHRFKCSKCDDWHEGLPYDFGTEAPSLDAESRAAARRTPDTCELGGDRWVRGCLEIPIIGGPGPLVYGVWVSLAPHNYEEFCARMNATDRYTDGPYFGWFNTALPRWPNTLGLKTHVHIRPPPLRPIIELEPTNHPLAVAQREGITVEQHRELALFLMHGAALH